MTTVTDNDQSFAARLLTWFDQHGRKDLPWQQNISPYRVWVSEIMLQQTQVTTVIPYYERFMDKFPSVQSLAAAPEDEVLHLWTGLGYYARARNLHRAAKEVVATFNGEFPGSIDGLVELPGIGRSTAGAIASIAMGLRAPILDGNVKRVLARHHAIAGWPGETATANQLWAIAEEHTPEYRIADYTQAIMDLGATVCTRSKPACDRCPVAASCIALANSEQTHFPGRKPKKALPVRQTVFILCRNPAGEVRLERRDQKGVWQGLWSFPEIARSEDVGEWCRHQLACEPKSTAVLSPLRHTFSHYHLDIQPLLVDVTVSDNRVAESDFSQWVKPAAPGALGLPAPVAALLSAIADGRLTQQGTLEH